MNDATIEKEEVCHNCVKGCVTIVSRGVSHLCQEVCHICIKGCVTFVSRGVSGVSVKIILKNNT